MHIVYDYDNKEILRTDCLLDAILTCINDSVESTIEDENGILEFYLDRHNNWILTEQARHDEVSKKSKKVVTNIYWSVENEDISNMIDIIDNNKNLLFTFNISLADWESYDNHARHLIVKDRVRHQPALVDHTFELQEEYVVPDDVDDPITWVEELTGYCIETAKVIDKYE